MRSMVVGWTCFLVTILLLASSEQLAAEDWPQFRWIVCVPLGSAKGPAIGVLGLASVNTDEPGSRRLHDFACRYAEEEYAEKDFRRDLFTAINASFWTTIKECWTGVHRDDLKYVDSHIREFEEELGRGSPS